MLYRHHMFSRVSIVRIFVFLVLSLGSMLPSPAQNQGSHGQQSGKTDNENSEFILIMTGMEDLPDGTLMPFRIFEAKDGSRADIKHATFRSPELAQAQLHLWLKSSQNPSSIEKRVDSSGKQIGERVVASFTDENRRKVFRVMWTEGPDFYVIGSLSRKTAFKLEQLSR